jgi:multimeric flavodoxin WrbA
MAINGSPRKNGNTATLLKKLVEGAESQNAQTQTVNLYDLDFKGCRSCFACKLTGGKSYGKCAVNDGLMPVLRGIEQADVLVLGTPVYWSGETGVMRSFLERLQFQYMLYDKAHTAITPKKISTALVFTMNVTEDEAKQLQYDRIFRTIAGRLQHIFGESQVLLSYNTYQFDDYGKYETSAFNADDKARQRDEVFPIDKEKAYRLGVSLATAKAGE